MSDDFSARHSMDSPDWYTPSPFVEAARELMGGIDLDPASDAEANKTVRAVQFFTEHDNGLSRPWFRRVFLNPPGGFVNEFWKHLVSDWMARHVSEAIWIGYSLEQLQTLQQSGAYMHPMDYAICVPSKRIAFVENEAKRVARIAKLTAYNDVAMELGTKPRRVSEKADSPSHGNYITYLGPNVDGFARIFEQFGKVKR